MKERVSLRRMTAFFTSILLVVFCLPTLALPAKAETTVRQVNNIVLFAQFDPLTEKNFMSGDATNTVDRKSTRLNSSHLEQSRMPSSA